MAEQPAREQGDPVLPPIHLTGLFVHAWRIYRRGALRWIAAYLVVIVPWYVVQSLIAGSVLVSDLDRLSGAALALVVVFIIPTVLGSLVTDALALSMAGTVAGRSVSVLEGLHQVRRSLPEFATAGLLAGAASTFLMLPPLSLLSVVGGGLALGLFFGPPLLAHVMVFERRRLRAAVSRVAMLARGSWLRIVGYMLAVMVLVAILQMFLIAAVSLIVPLGPPASSTAIAVLAAFVALFLPYLTAAWVVVYLDLRSRREGLGRAAFVEELDQVMSRQPGLTGP